MRKIAKHVACLVLAAASTVILTAASPAWAQDYPTAPVRILSAASRPAPPPTSRARVVGAKMGQILGQQFVVENRPGAASSIAGTQAARAPNDGYTLFVASAANMINAAMRPRPEVRHHEGLRADRAHDLDADRAGGDARSSASRASRS